MTKIIAVSNQKGGVGKTTNTMNIAAGLAERGYRVLEIDLDPNASLTEALGYDPYGFEDNIATLFAATMKRSDKVDEIAKRAVIEIHENLCFVPSGEEFFEIETRMITTVARETILSRVIEKICSVNQEEFDYILIDCPGSLSVLLINAFAACDSILIPVKAQFLDYKAFNKLYNMITLIREEINPRLKIEGVFLTMCESRLKLSKKVAAALNSIENEHIKVLNTRISPSTKVAEAPLAGQDIFTYAPSSKSAEEYNMLIDELLEVQDEE